MSALRIVDMSVLFLLLFMFSKEVLMDWELFEILDFEIPGKQIRVFSLITILIHNMHHIIELINVRIRR